MKKTAKIGASKGFIGKGSDSGFVATPIENFKGGKTKAFGKGKK